MRHWFFRAAGVCVLGLSCVALGASSTRPSKTDLSSPKSAAEAFVESLAEGDVANAQAAVIATPQQMQSVELLATMAGSMKKLTDAAVAKFGEEGAAISGQNVRLTQNLQQIEQAQVDINGDTATLSSQNGRKPVTLKNQGGQWKVDMSSMPGTEQLTQSAPAIRAMAKAASDTADDISADKFKTLDEARQAFQKQMMAALLTNMPTSRPAGSVEANAPAAPVTQP